MENKYIDYKMCGEITSVLVKGAQVACLPVSEQVHHIVQILIRHPLSTG